MTAHWPVPSLVEPDVLADLIADAQLIPLPRGSAPGPVHNVVPAGCVVIPPASVSLVEGSAEYGG
jgi:hypothetical protein